MEKGREEASEVCRVRGSTEEHRQAPEKGWGVEHRGKDVCRNRSDRARNGRVGNYECDELGRL